MDPNTIGLLAALAGSVLTVILHRYGIKVPGLPDPAVPPVLTPAPAPAPKPTPAPAADKPAVDFLAWLLKAKAGEIKLDNLDTETLLAIRPVFLGLLPTEQPAK